MVPSLDRIDRAILRELQSDGRLPNNVLAERVGLSPSPCLRRVRLLEEAGIIKRYVALVDAAKVGLGMTIFARISLVTQDEETTAGFIAVVEKLPEVIECQLMAGDCDFVLRIVTANLESYREFQMNHLGRVKGVQSIKTEIPMQTVKLTSAIPL
jgi:Lrp/AsnC family leucine-responsive transcriptional regulator